MQSSLPTELKLPSQSTLLNYKRMRPLVAASFTRPSPVSERSHGLGLATWLLILSANPMLLKDWPERLRFRLLTCFQLRKRKPLPQTRHNQPKHMTPEITYPLSREERLRNLQSIAKARFGEEMDAPACERLLNRLEARHEIVELTANDPRFPAHERADALKAELEEGGECRAGIRGVPGHIPTVTTKQWRAHFQSVHGSGNPGTSRKAFDRSKTDLQNRGRIQSREDFVWIP
jgi:hypothetical protein